MNKLVYWIEPRDGNPKRWYVWYWDHLEPLSKTLFDICLSRKAAQKAIKQHRQGKHPVQWTPDKIK